jgi:threonine/homoserine/homoserine lactone efflux protein
MDAQLWWMFSLGTLLVCASPGPNMLQVMGCSVRYGFRRAFFGMMGCFIPVFIFICISLAGVGALLEAFPVLFKLLRVVGASYLVYLGIMAWRAPVNAATIAACNETTPKTIFMSSFMVAVSNPKALLFAGVYFPLFINPNAPQAIQFAVLLATFTVLEFLCYLLYALGGNRLSAVLQNPRNRQRFNRFSGLVFVFFGVMILASPH